MTDGNSTLPDQSTSATERTEGGEVITQDEADITLDELESHLFECADIIRNRVDKTDYKEYILPLVFYKAFHDTYQDNYERVL
jgi:type I restriction enzyme M protein